MPNNQAGVTVNVSKNRATMNPRIFIFDSSIFLPPLSEVLCLRGRKQAKNPAGKCPPPNFGSFKLAPVCSFYENDEKLSSQISPNFDVGRRLISNGTVPNLRVGKSEKLTIALGSQPWRAPMFGR